MPELPEVETMRRGVAAVAGCTIRDCRRPRSRLQSIEMTPDLRSMRRRVVGRKIAAVGRIGKRIVLELDSRDRIVIEPRMSGAVILAGPRDRTHLRLILELSGPAKQLLFWDQRGLGVVRLVSPAEFESRYGADKIGPDALLISAAELRGRLGASRRADQGRLAGPEGRGRHRKHLRVGDSAPRRHSSRHALRQTDAAAMDEAARRDGEGPARGVARPGIDVGGQHLHDARRRSRAVTLPRLSASRAALPALWPGRNRAHRAGAAIHVLLPGVPSWRWGTVGAAFRRFTPHRPSP